MEGDLDKEIEGLVAQTEWKIPDKLFGKCLKYKENRIASSDQMDEYKDKIHLIKAQRQLDSGIMWRAIHKEMPAVPSDESLTMDFEKQSVILKPDSDSGPPGFLKRIFGISDD